MNTFSLLKINVQKCKYEQSLKSTTKSSYVKSIKQKINCFKTHRLGVHF